LGPDLAVRLLDLSETGARLLVKEALEKGQEVEVTFSAPGFPRPWKVLAYLVRCEPAADGSYRAAARFQKPLPYRDLHRLTAVS
jgi:hypothetical protein